MSSWGYRTFEDGIACDWLEAEILRSLLSGPRAGLPDAAVGWCEQNRDLDCRFLISHAIDAMKLILTNQSEMWVRWDDDADRFDCWSDHQQELIEDLKNALKDGL